jgi:hypothetical protein
METDRRPNRRGTRGKAEIQKLAEAAFSALEGADFEALFEQLHAAVFRRSPEELLDVELIDGVWEWRLKPMPELLLRHITEAASSQLTKAAERQKEIAWAVEMAGF